MRQTIYITAILAAAAGILLAQGSAVTREGDYWVQTFNGSEPTASGVRLRVGTPGAVNVQGTERSGIRWSLKLRVKASDQAQARVMLADHRVLLTRRGGLDQLTVQQGSGMSELTVEAPRRTEDVLIEAADGRVEAAGFDGSVRAENGGGSIRLDRIKGSVIARTGGGGVTLGAMGGNVHCITAGGAIRAQSIGGEANFESGGGDIVAERVGAGVRATTAGGAIRVGSAGAAVMADTQGGAIWVGHAGQIVVAKNSGGPIQIMGSALGAHCESAGGAIQLTNVAGSVRASTAMGSILAKLLNSAMQESFLSTGNGDVTVLIPSNLALTVRAQNELADSVRRIVSDFPGIAIRLQGGQVVGEGALNGGGPVLNISGTNGTIYIRRLP